MAFSVQSMKKVYKEMRKRKVKFTEGGSDSKMCFIEDPYGYETELLEEANN